MPSGTIVTVIGKGNWERIVLPRTPLLELTTYQQMQTVCSSCKGLGVCIPEDERCTKCRGKRTVVSPTVLEVPVERGARSGQCITLKGCSNERPGAAAGDVVVSVAPVKHARFVRKGDGEPTFFARNLPFPSI